MATNAASGPEVTSAITSVCLKVCKLDLFGEFSTNLNLLLLLGSVDGELLASSNENVETSRVEGDGHFSVAGGNLLRRSAAIDDLPDQNVT